MEVLRLKEIGGTFLPSCYIYINIHICYNMYNEYARVGCANVRASACRVIEPTSFVILPRISQQSQTNKRQDILLLFCDFSFIFRDFYFSQPVFLFVI